jgi:acetyltransferase-like isoleucine patch superfamily enzyme
MKQIFFKIFKLKSKFYKSLNINRLINRNFFIHPTAKIEEKIKIGENTEIWEYVIIRKGTDLEIGNYTQIGPFSVLFGGNKIKIGHNVLIAPHCVIAASNHDYKQSERPMRFAGAVSAGPIIIENNVWIGANCTITDNVIIGEGAVIAANSVVTKDIPANSIAAGVPAKILRYRNNE